jgi:hypothetical protein
VAVAAGLVALLFSIRAAVKSRQNGNFGSVGGEDSAVGADTYRVRELPGGREDDDGGDGGQGLACPESTYSKARL